MSTTIQDLKYVLRAFAQKSGIHGGRRAVARAGRRREHLFRRTVRLAVCGVALVLLAACRSGPFVALHTMPMPPCAAAGRAIGWAGPQSVDARARLSAWCESVGPSVVRAPGRAGQAGDILRDGLVVVTWNIHEGGGDLDRLFAALRPRASQAAVIVLVQEGVRNGAEVPAVFPDTVKAPRRIRPKDLAKNDLAAFAERMGLWLAYAPSMRNGRDAREDRGCAVLSTLPLSDVVGIELPWVSQRRVAVMATVSGRKGEVPWRLRVVSVHLDNRRGRSSQAAALARFITTRGSDETPIVIGGDLNTWFGAGEKAVRLVDAVVPRVGECGEAPTFRLGRHLDYLFTTLEPEARRACEISRDSFGSDHHPTILRLFGEP